MSSIPKAVVILNAKKGWSDVARAKAALKRRAKRKRMNLSDHVAHGNLDYREATNKIAKARQSMEKRIKAGDISPEERGLFSKRVKGFHNNLLKKVNLQIKAGNHPPEAYTKLKKEIQSFLDDEAYSASMRKTKARNGKRPNSGKSPFGPGN